MVLDFSNFMEWDKIEETDFKSLLKKRQNFRCILSLLREVYYQLQSNGILQIYVLGKNISANILKRFFDCSQLNMLSYNNSIAVLKKRKLKKYAFHQGRFTFEETIDSKKIKEIQKFSASLFPDHNFDFEIDDLFNANSNFYYVYDNENGQILNFMRLTWHLPKYQIPCTLAVDEKTGHNIMFKSAINDNFIEIMSPLVNILSQIKVYKHFVKNLVGYGKENAIDYLITTSNLHQPKNGRGVKFLTKSFGFNDTETNLQYGDFGGQWRLVMEKFDRMLPSLNKFSSMEKEAYTDHSLGSRNQDSFYYTAVEPRKTA